MRSSNLEIWTIQDDPLIIFNALSKVKNSSTNMLFTNCISCIKLGKTQLPIYFNTAFYSAESDCLILLVQDGIISSDELKELLVEQGIGDYHEINFQESRPKDNKLKKELCFARDYRSLEKTIKNSKEKGIDTCDYYSDLKGRFELRYVINKDKGTSAFDYRIINGVVVLEDKIVLQVTNREKKNASFHDTLRILDSSGMTVSIKKEVRDFPEEIIPKTYKKGQ